MLESIKYMIKLSKKNVMVTWKKNWYYGVTRKTVEYNAHDSQVVKLQNIVKKIPFQNLFLI